MPAAVTDNAILRAALEYAELGLQVVKLYYILPDGTCSCHKGKKCDTPGKHPNLGKNWQQSATNSVESLERWWTHDPRANVGVMMGPRSGIIDVEFDDEEGRQTAEKFLGECYTPTFRSGRSVHRLFKYDEIYATSAVEKIMGLEFRIGSPKACQSVFPPSAHWTGRQYEWLPGLSHLEVEFSGLPDGLQAILLNHDLGGADRNGSSASRAKLYSQPTIVETLDGRDTTMHSEACGLWRERVMAYGGAALDDPEHQRRVYQILLALNRMKCVPPLSDDVIQGKCEGARKFVARQVATEGSEKEKSLTALGLEFRNGEWLPGQWFVEIIEADPPTVKLYAPFLPKKFVQLFMEDYDSPGKVHLAALKENPKVCLSDRPGFWAGIWNGFKDGKGVVHVGLKAKLLSDGKVVAGPIELKKRTSVAEFVFAWLDKASSKSSDFRKPFCDEDGDVWFRFSELYKQAQFDRTEFTRLDLSRSLRGAGAKEDWFPVPGGRKKLLRLSRDGMRKLESTGADEAAAELSANSVREPVPG